jgi:ribosomal-protein-alanine N-acetyltransferase
MPPARPAKPTIEPTLRPARPTDVDALLALEERAFRTDRISRRSFRHFLAAPRGVLTVAELSGRIAGYALVMLRANSSAARLYSLAVASDAAGQGIGQALLAAAESIARLRGASAMRLEVHERNRRAARLYRQSGYKQIGRREAYYEDGGAALRFEKRLLP